MYYEFKLSSSSRLFYLNMVFMKNIFPLHFLLSFLLVSSILGTAYEKKYILSAGFLGSFITLIFTYYVRCIREAINQYNFNKYLEVTYYFDEKSFGYTGTLPNGNIKANFKWNTVKEIHIFKKVIVIYLPFMKLFIPKKDVNEEIQKQMIYLFQKNRAMNQ